MGGGSSAQVVGYKYYAGMHMILSHGPIDGIRTFEVDKKLVWSGLAQDDQININQPGLFGGDTREGGIVGNVDVESGKDDQTQNDYLQSKIIEDLPAFRGVVGVILRGLYLGVNPYLKKWAFRAQRVFVRQNGIDQWYSAKAPLPIIQEPAAMLFAMDFSASMLTITPNGKSRFENMKDAIFAVLDTIQDVITYDPFTPRIDILFTGFGGGVSPFKYTMERRNIDTAAIADLKTFFNNTPKFTTRFDYGVEDAEDFFNNSESDARRYSFFVTDGGPYNAPNPENPSPIQIAQMAHDLLFAASDVTAFAFNIDLTDTTFTAYLDNTPSDGVPVLSGDNLDKLNNTIIGILASHIDLNPAHIIRECLTDSSWGMGYPESDIDDVSFAAAADTLFEEHFGISLLWDKQIPLNDFIVEIIRHIDAALYVDRKTGKFVLKLIRDDYDEGSLITLDPSNTKNVTNFVRPTVVDLANSITVNFWDYKTGETSSISVEDPALIQMQQAVINTTIQYPGISNQPLASRVALRDAMTLSSPLIRGMIECNQVAKDFDIGEVFKLTWPDYDVDSILVRVTALSFGDGKNNRIKISFVQDKFSFSTVSIIAESDDEWTEPGGPPLPVEYQLALEASYYTLIQTLGQTLVDDGLTADADAGYITVAGVRSQNGLSARLWVSSSGPGGTYVDTSPLEFCPTATLLVAITYLDTIISLENVDDLDEVTIGTYAQIGDEVVSIIDVDTEASTVTIGRGVLDTLPAIHVIEERIFFYSLYIASDTEEYTAPEEIGTKLTTISSEGELAVGSAPERSVTMGSRAIRPYPPGQIKIDSSFYPTAVLGLNDVTISWVGRDRTQQTAGLIDFTFGNIGPEAGTTYTLKCYNEDDVLSKTYTGLTGTSQTWTTEITDSGLGRYNEQLRFVLYSVRDGYDSYQIYDYTFIREATPVNVTPPVITVL